MRGRILRMTPVERMSMVLTTGVVGLARSVALEVVTGIWLPTSSRAGWLSTTTSDGEDNTLTSVMVESAFRITRGCASGPSSKLKPGSTRCRTALWIAWATEDEDDDEEDEDGAGNSPTEPLSEAMWASELVKKCCTPYCRSSVSVTSATVASIETCNCGRSRSCKACSMMR